MAKPSLSASSPLPGTDKIYSSEMEFNSDNGVGKADANGITSTGQPLTPVHSRLYSLLSWERPRTTAVSYATVIVSIIAARYLPLLRWALKLLYLALGGSAILEVTGRSIFSRGLTSTSRPRKYYTIPKDTVESVLEDIEQLVDFFLIEFQRILFVENLAYTVGAFTVSLISYWLVKFLPIWTLALMGATVAYLAPLIYVSNKEFVDEQVVALQEIINAQTSQVKEMAESQTAQATGIMKQYVSDYRAKAHEYVVATRSRQPSPEVESTNPIKTEPQPEVKREPEPEPEPEPAFQHSDFPEAPQEEPTAEPKKEDEVNPELISV